MSFFSRSFARLLLSVLFVVVLSFSLHCRYVFSFLIDSSARPPPPFHPILLASQGSSFHHLTLLTIHDDPFIRHDTTS